MDSHPEQLVLFAVSDAERTLLNTSPRYRELGETERRFAVAWLETLRETPGRRPSIDEVAAKAGIGRTRGYELLKTERVLAAIRETAQAHGDLADVAGSMAYDLLCLDALQKAQRGELNSLNLPATTLRLLQDAVGRLGRDPRLTVGLGVSLPGGAAASVGVSGAAPELDTILGRLGDLVRGEVKPEEGEARTEGTGSGQGGAESVREGECTLDATDGGAVLSEGLVRGGEAETGAERPPVASLLPSEGEDDE
jgi:hypothetical protein